MPTDDSKIDHVIVLVYGIRDRALWQNTIRSCLQDIPRVKVTVEFSARSGSRRSRTIGSSRSSVKSLTAMPGGSVLAFRGAPVSSKSAAIASGRAGLHDVPAQRQIDRVGEILAGGIVENLIAQHNALCALRHKRESRLSHIREGRCRQI
jgi:hypothetical protein